jgi:hypothetical protein
MVANAAESDASAEPTVNLSNLEKEGNATK